MQIYREITPVKEDDFFIIRSFLQPDFNYPIHMHPEYELNLVLNCSGSRIVGDSLGNFDAIDLALIGPDIYHSWDSDEDTTLAGSNARVITIQFGEDLFSDKFLSKKDLRPIRSLLKNSSRGLVFGGNTRERVSEMMHKQIHREGFHSILSFLEILHELGTSEEWQYLASEGFLARTSQHNSKRITRVYEYILENYTRQINLTEVAEIASMSPSAFSHFFKRSTNKSFTQFVIDLRLGHAARLLVETQDQISEICYACGFNNVSNFNRLFKKQRKITPVKYRKIYQTPPKKKPAQYVVN